MTKTDLPTDEETQILQESLRATLQNPAGYVVMLYLLRRMNAFLPTDTPDSLARRDLAEDLFEEIEIADPQAALKLFADLRGFPCIVKP